MGSQTVTAYLWLSPTTAGTPQGGSSSPLLALIALHGMDQAITRVYPHARVIAYADPYSYQAPRHCIDTNVIGTLNVLQACLEERVLGVYPSA